MPDKYFVPCMVFLAKEPFELHQLVRRNACAISDIDLEISAEVTDAPLQFRGVQRRPDRLGNLARGHVLAAVTKYLVDRVVLCRRSFCRLSRLFKSASDRIANRSRYRRRECVANLTIPSGLTTAELPF